MLCQTYSNHLSLTKMVRRIQGRSCSARANEHNDEEYFFLLFLTDSVRFLLDHTSTTVDIDDVDDDSATPLLLALRAGVLLLYFMGPGSKTSLFKRQLNFVHSCFGRFYVYSENIVLG